MKRFIPIIILLILIVTIVVSCNREYEYPFSQDYNQIEKVEIVYVANDNIVVGGFHDSIKPLCTVDRSGWDSFFADFHKISCKQYWNDPASSVTGNVIRITYKDGGFDLISGSSGFSWTADKDHRYLHYYFDAADFLYFINDTIKMWSPIESTDGTGDSQADSKEDNTQQASVLLEQAAAARLSEIPEENLTVNSTVTFQNDRLFCVLFEGTVCDPTAAHPTDFAFSLCADMAQAQTIDPLTLFLPDSSFIRAFREQLNTLSCPERFTPEDWESVRAYIGSYSDDELLQIICATPEETLAFYPDSVTVLFPVPQSAGNYIKIPVPTAWNTSQPIE